MKTIDKKTKESLDEIVFEDRNKEYGAYQLRKGYKKTMNKALSIAVALMLIGVVGPLLANYFNRDTNIKLGNNQTIEFEGIKPPEEIVTPPPPPPDTKIDKQIRFQAPQVIDSEEDISDFDSNDEMAKNMTKISLDTLGVTVKKDDDDTKEITEDKKKILSIVEEMPEYPGGYEAMMLFLSKTVVYPPAARETGAQGKVYVRFVVTNTGDVDQISIIRKVDPLLEEEAMRVIKLMPKWRAGRQQGNAVNVWYTIPIVFKLENR